MDFTATAYKVYARTDENNKVIKIFSTCFEKPGDTDILLKEGSGDEFVHVGYYQILNDDMTHKYCIENGEIRECTADEIEAEKATFPAPPPTTEERLTVTENNVRETTEMFDMFLTEVLPELLGQ